MARARPSSARSSKKPPPCPAILFIDEIDAVAPKRTEVVGEVEKRVGGGSFSA